MSVERERRETTHSHLTPPPARPSSCSILPSKFPAHLHSFFLSLCFVSRSSEIQGRGTSHKWCLHKFPLSPWVHVLLICSKHRNILHYCIGCTGYGHPLRIVPSFGSRVRRMSHELCVWRTDGRHEDRVRNAPSPSILPLPPLFLLSELSDPHNLGIKIHRSYLLMNQAGVDHFRILTYLSKCRLVSSSSCP